MPEILVFVGVNVACLWVWQIVQGLKIRNLELALMKESVDRKFEIDVLKRGQMKFLKKQVRNQVRNQVRYQVRNQVRYRVRYRVGYQVWDQVGYRVRYKVKENSEKK